MSTKFRFPISLLLAGGALLAAILSCNFETRESMTITYEQYYSFDPPSLLRTIGTNGVSPFVPIDDRPELPPPTEQIPVDWKQADYINLINAIINDIWGETDDDWRVNSVYFALGCAEIDDGFQNMYFRFFRNERSHEQESRLERFINIDPRSKSAYVVERVYSPRLVDWGSVDLSHLQVSADDALILAESSGGKEKRLAADNECDITLTLSPDSAGYQGWNVRYASSDAGKLFELSVDPVTGEIHFQ